MTALEEQLAALLAEAPGEPPNPLDADSVLAHASRRRYLAPLLAAAAVVAIAVAVTVLAVRDSGSPPTAAPRPTVPPRDGMSLGQAIKLADDTLRSAPTLPAAQEVPNPPTLVLEQPATTSSAPTLVQRTRFWVAPGTVAAAMAYFTAHPPAGMHRAAYGNSSGPGQSGMQFVQFEADKSLSLEFSVVASGSGVAVRADAQLVRVPVRPQWAWVADSVTSADVSVIRHSGNPHAVATPTVRRTLTGEAAVELARAINALPSRAPEGTHGCLNITVQGLDKVVFHGPGGDTQVLRGGSCAWTAAITPLPSHRHAYVDGNAFTQALVTALGLPADYGYSR